MKIFINGEQREESVGLTVSDLLEHLGIKKERVAVELNLDIVPKGMFADTILKEGDRVEIVSFVGGGAGCVPSILSVEQIRRSGHAK